MSARTPIFKPVHPGWSLTPGRAKLLEQASLRQLDLEFDLPAALLGLEVLTSKQVARIIGYREKFVEMEAACGALEYWQPHGREVNRKRFTRRSVLLWRVEHMNLSAQDREEQLIRWLRTLNTAALTQLIVLATAERGRAAR